MKRPKLGQTGICRNCGILIETHDYDWSGGIQWKHVGGYPECKRRRATPIAGESYRGHPLPKGFKDWTLDKQDGATRYIDYLLELEGVPIRRITHGPDHIEEWQRA